MIHLAGERFPIFSLGSVTSELDLNGHESCAWAEELLSTPWQEQSRCYPSGALRES